MDTRINLPRIDPVKFGKSWVLRKASRSIEQVINWLGADRIRFLIENDKDLSVYLPVEKAEPYRLVAQRYSWAGKLISDEDFMQILPLWASNLIKSYGDKGDQWLKRQLSLIRAFIAP